MKILELSATELAKKIKAGEITSEEAAKASLAQIAKEDQKIRAYLTVDEEKVLERAKEVDNGIRSGKYTGPLAGVPIAVKDNICTKDMRTTCASKILENFVPFYDATAVTRITDAGMVILGKTNMDEFAMGSTTETSAFAVTKNPWDTEHVPVPARRSQPVNASRLSALIPADPSVSQAPTAALPESSRHTERFPVLVLWLTRPPWTRSDRLARMQPTVQPFLRPSQAMTRGTAPPWRERTRISLPPSERAYAA